MPPVTILLAARDAGAHLGPQLQSLAAQTVPWRLLAGDDGSTDGTRAALEAVPGATVIDGPRQGPAAHFRALLARAPEGPAAFCDQDDLWYPGKLARALAALADVAEGTPALYAARTRIVDEAGRPTGLSPTRSRPTGFANALVQSIAGGNTMVMNAPALRLLQAADAEAPEAPHHDWWAYQIVSGAGGAVLYDPEPCLDYRQHAGNAVGARSLGSKLGSLVSGAWAGWIGAQLPALEASRARLTGDARRRLDLLAEARAARGGLRRLRLLRQADVYRQERAGDVALTLAALRGTL